MQDKINIRKAVPSDVEKAAEIAVAAYKPIYDSFYEVFGKEMFEDLYPNWQDIKTKQIIRSFNATNNYFVDIVEKDGMVIGFITYFINTDSCTGTIDNNAIHPSYQGRGLGHFMYEHVFKRFKDEGMKYAEVTTGGDVSHVSARRAYERAGFNVQIPSVKYYKKL